MSWGSGIFAFGMNVGMGSGEGRNGPSGRGVLAASDEDLGKVFDWRLMKRVAAYIRPYKRRAAGGVVAMLVLQSCAIAQPRIFGLGVDRARAMDGHGVAVLVGFFLLASLIAWLATYEQSYQMTRVGQFVLYDIASDMFTHIAKMSLSFFDKNETGRIMARVQNDVGVLQNFLSQGLIATAGNCLQVIGILIIMFATMNWRLAALTAATVPVFMGALFIWQAFSRRTFRQARATISVVNASLQENVSGVRVIQSLGREGVNSRRFEEANRSNLRANLGASKVAAAADPIIEVTSALALVLLLIIGGKMVMDGSLSLGEFTAFLVYRDNFFHPLRQMAQQYNQFQRSSVAIERIIEILDIESDVKDAPDASELPPIEGRVAYEHVNFNYIPGVDIFNDLNIDIKAGEHVALVGQTGAGKSTIVSLLMRFYDVTSGRITVDGHDIRDVTMNSLRKQLGIVLQEPVLFSGTIAHNIRYARPDATAEEVVEAARSVGLHETIMKMPDGYDSHVNERGIGLSIGQRQLISFARVLIANPRILLLDEATASLDTSTELVVQTAIRKVTEGRTAIMIAHRLSTIRDADRIIVLEHGHVIEEGTHDELISSRGAYYRYYSMSFEQMVDSNVEAAATE